ncbi:MAG TPA: RNA polymerase sigma factor [bacterium]|nr:RNA polymerase sigma factor [bacterium]HPN31198.1 RNA polymerase sigma factor [bacterium]
MNKDKLKFDGIYESHKEGVFAFILSRTKNKDDSWDIFQDVFSKVFEKIGELQEDRNIKSYIFTLTYNKIIDFFRKKKPVSELDENLECVNNGYNDFSLLKMDIQEAMKQLTPREKETFELKYFFNFKISEISEKLNIGEGAVKRYLFDAALKLKESLK